LKSTLEPSAGLVTRRSALKRRATEFYVAVTTPPGEFMVVPRGVEHRPVADEVAEIILFVPAGIRNTGNLVDEVFTAPTGVRV
jgi:hypothetical protein